MRQPRVIVDAADTRSKWNSGRSTIACGSAVKQGDGDDAVEVAISSSDVVLGLLADADLGPGSQSAGCYQNIQIHNLARGIAGTGGVSAGTRLTVDPQVPGALVEARPVAGQTVTVVGVANRTAFQGELFEVELAGPGASLSA